jgi:hypothetical protein
MDMRSSGRLLLAALALLVIHGCARPQPLELEPPTPALVVETGSEVALSAGRACHSTDGFAGGAKAQSIFR